MNLGTMGTSGFTVWLTGMSGSGKSTLAQGLANRLRRLGKVVDVLDGPEMEQMLGIGGAATKDERNAEARKLAWVCKLVTRGGGIIIQSAIESPYREAREDARRQIGRFAEVFVECPTETLIQRDRTGRYKRALAGELKTLPGITEPYEPPAHPEDELTLLAGSEWPDPDAQRPLGRRWLIGQVDRHRPEPPSERVAVRVQQPAGIVVVRADVLE